MNVDRLAGALVDRYRIERELGTADGSGGAQQVSVNGGREPLWTRGGRELVFRNIDAMMAAPVDPATGRAGRPVELFRHPSYFAPSISSTYDVTPDGSRFLIVRTEERPDAQPVTVVPQLVERIEAEGALAIQQRGEVGNQPALPHRMVRSQALGMRLSLGTGSGSVSKRFSGNRLGTLPGRLGLAGTKQE